MSAVEEAKPDLGVLVPGWSVRAFFALVAVSLCIGLAQPGFWLTVALLLAIAAAAVPRTLAPWFLIGVLAFSVLLREQSVGDWRAYALIAGAHALHVLGSWMLVVRPSSSLQPAALWPSTRRFLLIQVPVQVVAAGALALTAATAHSLLPLAVVAGAGIVALTVALTAPLLHRPRPRP